MQGTYKDSDQTVWTWDCDIKEEEIFRPDEELKGEDWLSRETYRDPDAWMEWVLWTTYLSGLGWVIGYITFIPLGFFVYFGWIQYWCWFGLYQLFFEKMDGIAYANGPFRRFFVGSFIYTLAAIGMLIPGLNFITSPLLGWWAVLDYFDYK